MKLIGKWDSLTYSGIFGNFEMKCNDFDFGEDNNNNFIASLRLIYSEKSTYKPDVSIDIDFEALYEYDNDQKIHRIIFRQIEFSVSQYFTLTLHSSDKKKWSGYMTCICPVDCIKLYNVVSEIINTGYILTI